MAVVSRVWVAEDAYITFRVVENLFAGHGLVFNPGDRVEAFTHPLWMLCLVLIKTVGLPLHGGSVLVGLVLSLAGLYLLIFRRGTNGILLAAPALCALSGFRDFATGGMEFSLVFLILVVLDRLLDGQRIQDRPAAIATALSLLYLTRPELALAAIYYSVLLLPALLKPEAALSDRLRLAIRWAVPFLLLAGGWHLFRGLYYHDIFPNTYYAKSGAAAHTLQGLKYLAHTLAYGPSVWAVLIVLLAYLGLHELRSRPEPRRVETVLRDLGLPLLLVAYWVRAGGDFMSFRFLLPAIVLLALLAQRLLAEPEPQVAVSNARVPSIQTRISLVLLMLFAALALVPAPYARGYIADERQVFTKDVRAGLLDLALNPDSQPWSRRGRAFRDLQRCLHLPELRITNSQASARCLQGVGLGYFGVASGPGVVILDEQGLPNRSVASQPIVERFRPGHEHFVTLEDVIKFGAAFCSTGEADYDRTMVTNAGIVIRLAPEFVLTLPDAARRLETLVRLKRRGSLIIPRLEQRYQVRVEELARLAARRNTDPLVTRGRRCWDAFPGGPDTFFY